MERFVTSWLDCVDQPSALTIHSIFGDGVPSLIGIDLHEVRLVRDGPTVELRFDLPVFPAPAPAKWKAQGFNRVQLRLAAVGVSEVEISGIATTCVLDMQIIKVANFVHVAAASGMVKIRIAAESLNLRHISAYLDDGQEAR